MRRPAGAPHCSSGARSGCCTRRHLPNLLPMPPPVLQVPPSVPALHRPGRVHAVPGQQRQWQVGVPGTQRPVPRLPRHQLPHLHAPGHVRHLPLWLPQRRGHLQARLQGCALPAVPRGRRQVHQLRRHQRRLLHLPQPCWPVQGGECVAGLAREWHRRAWRAGAAHRMLAPTCLSNCLLVLSTLLACSASNSSAPAATSLATVSGVR